MNFLTRWWNRRKLKVELPKPEPWRVCESCSMNEAEVFCRSHSCYLCGRCIGAHNLAKLAYGISTQCTYMDLYSAAELMTGKVR